MALSELEKEFEDVAFHLGGVFHLRPEDALRFVEEHREAETPILGIDEFWWYQSTTERSTTRNRSSGQ